MPQNRSAEVSLASLERTSSCGTLQLRENEEGGGWGPSGKGGGGLVAVGTSLIIGTKVEGGKEVGRGKGLDKGEDRGGNRAG